MFIHIPKKMVIDKAFKDLSDDLSVRLDKIKYVMPEKKKAVIVFIDGETIDIKLEYYTRFKNS